MSMCYWCKIKCQCKQPEWHIRAVGNDDLYCDAFTPVALPSISMAYVTASFVTMNKSVTRRSWQPVTIKRFKKDAYFLAWNKQQRFGGEPIGIGRTVLDVLMQSTKDMVAEDYGYEGFEYLDDRYVRIVGSDDTYPLLDAFDRWQDSDQILSVVPFMVVEVFPGCMDKYSTDKEIMRCVKASMRAIG